MEVAASSVKETLRKCQVFSTVDDASLERIAASAIEQRYEGGTVLFQEGDKANELLVVQEGKVALQMMLTKTAAGGRRITIDTVMPNELVGWSAVVEPHIYTLTAVCLQNTRVLSISGNKLQWLLQEDKALGFEIMQGLIKVVASRLDDTRRVLLAERALV
jgi:CRP-like cAMP-binding protein